MRLSRFGFITGAWLVSLSLPITAIGGADDIGKQSQERSIAETCETTTKQVVTMARSGRKVIAQINWCLLRRSTGHAREEFRIPLRINEEDTLVLRTTNFNFLHHEMKYGFDVQPLEAYVTLDQLFKQIVGLVPAVQRPAPSDPSPLVNWYVELEIARSDVVAFLAGYAGRQALSDTELKTIETKGNGIPAVIKKLEALRIAARDRLKQLDPGYVEFYESVKHAHEETLRQLAAFQSAARRTARGDDQEVGADNAGPEARKAGSFVKVTLTPIDQAGKAQDDSFTVTYFVHSKLPVLFHVGLAVSTLKDVNFESVRALASSDLFSEVQSNQNTGDFSAFLSFELFNWSEELGGGGVSATLGTSLQDVGSTFHVGGSVRVFKRVMITVGVTSKSVAEGESPVVEALGDELGSRVLFETVAKRRDWGLLTGVSFSVF